ncbi:hypothetical protein [Rhizobium jaguaris]|uniref:Uncharacterized protein n=1 Tax=Rhizobium jaguaris TaxID=1312183 RepID=A0A387FF45_9HYPH|nr:hypothetical protein [Rhizobium jaguaris]AYG57820.1 hypothetical protein CCGE525_02595 [Rhizobium jaguaris]
MNAVDKVNAILDDAIPHFQDQMGSMSQGCGFGKNGGPPLDWQSRQQPGNAAIKAFDNARVALAQGRIPDAKQQIDSGLSQWDTLISSLAGSCPIGAHGTDPASYGAYQRFRDVVKAQLQVAVQFLD